MYKLNRDGSQGKIVWESKTGCSPGAGSHAEFHGNLVVYGGEGNILWASETDAKGTDTNHGKGILFKLPDVGQMRITVQKTNSDEQTILPF